ncbi:siderophore synthetase component [Prauserella sediminis]|uniref:Siderophore synthetase component n=1 Tax=Prauserella sediminis TaxID=577680 RepID=A0A839XRN0_9PSEU|nr:IucA/IucC family protein [Prauserella sediminis]MBB3663608.1 siderophore synthetase component [Prauserella sediminis]
MTVEFVERALTGPGFGTVRRRVLRQLLESLVYEQAIKAEEVGPGRYRVDGDGVSYEFTAFRRHGFGRVGLGRDPVLRIADTTEEAESALRFLHEVRDAVTADPDCLVRFARELARTELNDALAQLARAERGDVLADSGYDRLECAITDGHRYHPTYKSRMGFDVEDNLAFGPEFAPGIRPLWLAARRSIAEVSKVSVVDERDYLRAQLGEEVYDEFTRRADPGEYTYLPVHPWQWREVVTGAFAEQLASGDLVVLGEDPMRFSPQQSIRTLSCDGRPYLKLALSIVNTSTSRVLAPHTVANAPRISEWLRGVVDGDPFLREECRLIVLGEVMGTAVSTETVSGETYGTDTYGTLSCIWRENLHDMLEDGERAVPFNGLTACELDGTPLIDPWVRRLGPAEWLKRVVDVSVLPVIHLLCRHGIAVESHAQNMVLVHSDGVPTRVALKDFHDGVRFSRAELADPERCPTLRDTPEGHGNRNSFVETDDLGLVADFVLDAFFFINIGELGIFLADAYGFDEREFWAIVRERIGAYRQRFPEFAERFVTFDVAKPGIDVEKLTTRRLLPDTELRLQTVPNPLAEEG